MVHRLATRFDEYFWITWVSIFRVHQTTVNIFQGRWKLPKVTGWRNLAILQNMFGTNPSFPDMYMFRRTYIYSFWDSKLYSLDFSVILSTKRNYVYSTIIKIHRKIVIYFHYFSLFFFFTWSMIGPIFGPVSMKLLQLLFIVEGMGNFVVNQRFVPCIGNICVFNCSVKTW